MLLIVGLLLLCCYGTSMSLEAGYAQLGILFKETLVGYQATGNISYAQGYAQGQKLGQSVSFQLTVLMPDMQAFIQDPTHTANVYGTVFAKGYTSIFGAQTNGTLQIFPEGVMQDELVMYYNLPFKGSDGNQYHLEGTKHLVSSNCLHIISMATTAYINVRTGSTWQQGSILTSGIIVITPMGVIDFLLSYRIMGNGTLADKLHDVISFVSWLGSDIITDCAQSPDQLEWHFWYIWASDGNQGFLLDLIQQPTQLELRLETYTQQQSPVLTRVFLPLSDLSVNGDTITMGSLTLTNQSCTGILNGTIDVNASFALSDRTNMFIAHMAKFIEDIIPDPFSTYGALTAPTSVGGISLSSGTPLVFTTYSMNLGIDIWRWVMLSTTFVGSGGGKFPDLQVEIIGFPGSLKGVAPVNGSDIYLGTSYIYYQGVEYHLNDVFLNQTWWQLTGQVMGSSRYFGVVVDTPDINLQISCEAPVSVFAVLDSYALTNIHTTVLGSCKASVYIPNGPTSSYQSNAALLEIKAFQY